LLYKTKVDAPRSQQLDATPEGKLVNGERLWQTNP
jgi:hypothetical protein